MFADSSAVKNLRKTFLQRFFKVSLYIHIWIDIPLFLLNKKQNSTICWENIGMDFFVFNFRFKLVRVLLNFCFLNIEQFYAFGFYALT